MEMGFYGLLIAKLDEANQICCYRLIRICGCAGGAN